MTAVATTGHTVMRTLPATCVLFLLGLSTSAIVEAQDELSFDQAVSAADSMPRLRSILVSHSGTLHLERYLNGTDASDLANVKSVSKSVISALVGIAIAEGHIQGVEQQISTYFEDELTEPGGEAKGRITIDDLLTMQSGLETTSNRNYGAWVLSSNWLGFALAQPLERQPGILMEYSTGNTHILSAIITSASEMSTLDFARQTLSAPLGFRLASWPTDPQGIYFGGNDMEFTPRQMLAFGELYLNGGRANGEQIIPEDWVADSLRARAISTREDGRYYGYGWWIREMAGFSAPYAWGYGGQFIILVPDLELIVVTTSSSFPGEERREHLRRLLDLIEFEVVAVMAESLRRR
jgi:CubicO group peptidase (beta-lactamase class C family)